MIQQEGIKVSKKRRSKGDGAITEYRPGHYRAFLDIGYNEAGKRIRKSFTNTNKTELIKQLNEYKAQQQRGELVADKQDTLNDYVKRWLQLKKIQVKESTYQSYEYIYNYHIKKLLGDYRLQKITPSLLNDYFTTRQIEAKLSSSSVARHKAVLHNIFKTALYEGLIYNNPVERTTIIKVAKPDVKALTVEEVSHLLGVAQNIYLANKGKKDWEKKNVLCQLYHIVYLAILTGLRRGELLALKWSSINRKDKTLTVTEGIVEVKGGSKLAPAKTENSRGRIISLNDDIIKLLDGLRRDEDSSIISDYIFHSANGRHLIPSNLNRAFNILLNKAKIKCRFHDLRHTNATLLISNGLDIKTVSERLGHADITTTLNKYTHVIRSVDQKATETMLKILNTNK